jgi:hypothetical protein
MFIAQLALDKGQHLTHYKIRKEEYGCQEKVRQNKKNRENLSGS